MPGALVKACLICAGVVRLDSELSLQTQLAETFADTQPNLKGIELEMWSELPQGSGLAGSSILAATLMAALWKLRRLEPSRDDLVHAVLNVEQLTTTNGGWQDTLGSLYGGVKLGCSDAGLPLRVRTSYMGHECEQASDEESDSESKGEQVTRIPGNSLTETQREFLRGFNDRLFLVYTGKTRLARNLLQDVVRNWNSRDSNVCSVVDRLACSGAECFSHFLACNLAGVAAAVNEYRELKKLMAPGSEPEQVKRLRAELCTDGASIAMCTALAGAGGGGFLHGLLHNPSDRPKLTQIVQQYPDMSMYEAQVDYAGIIYSFT